MTHRGFWHRSGRGTASSVPKTVGMGVRVGAVELPSPVMLASGTAGHGAELSKYFDLASIGAVVVKSLSADPWAGNPAPRVTEVGNSMLNSVGLQNPGVEHWRATPPRLFGTVFRNVRFRETHSNSRECRFPVPSWSDRANS